MKYYLTINKDTVKEYDNETAYVLEIQRLRKLGFKIEYVTGEGREFFDECYAAK